MGEDFGISIIDYSRLVSSFSSSPQGVEDLHKFKSAITSWGCFQLVNHGIPTWLLDELREVSRQFFEVSSEEKQKYSVRKDDLNNGYDGHQMTVANNSNDDPFPDCNEMLSLTVSPHHRRKLEFWPENPPKYKTLLDEYTARVADIFDVLFKMIVRSLNVNEEEFDRVYGKNKEINMRCILYPPRPEQSGRGVLGMKPHSDFSAMTLLLQDEEGLQVLKDGQWFMVPVISDALFLVLGDPTEILSNGIYKSAIHRVVTNPEKSRLSIALFWDSDRDNPIEPLGELVTASRPQNYERVSLKDYSTKFVEYYRSGQRVIDDVKINY